MATVSQDLSVTSYALLGLLVLDGVPAMGSAGGEAPLTGGRGSEQLPAGMTGYEVKQRADKTLRFYWVSPAMSQVYSELERLAQRGLVSADETGQRRARRFAITEAGLHELREWLGQANDVFPILKHPVALRLLMSGLSDVAQTRSLLDRYLDQLALRRRELLVVRQSLGDRDEVRYPAMVADWGLEYYESETRIVSRLLTQLAAADAPEPTARPTSTATPS